MEIFPNSKYYRQPWNQCGSQWDHACNVYEHN